MSREFEAATKEGRLIVKEYKNGLEIVRYEGGDIYLEIPNQIKWQQDREPEKLLDARKGTLLVQKKEELELSNENEAALSEKPVLSIGKKAMLSCKNLRSVRLPETIEEIGDWAFAYCDGLREIILPKKEIQFGRGIFRECTKFHSVAVEGNHPDVGGLLASAVTLLDAPYLFHPVQSGGAEWLRQWDAKMLQMLRLPDQDGYSKMVLCGEEDYGSKENNFDYYVSQKRKSKVRIAFMRLLNPLGLAEETKQELEQYLREHTAGAHVNMEMEEKDIKEIVGRWDSLGKDIDTGKKNIVQRKNSAERNNVIGSNNTARIEKMDRERSDETWQVLHEEHGEDSSYYKLFTRIGCLTEANFDRILSQTGEEYPEMKAWFLKYKEEKIGYPDFFDALCSLS